MTSVSSPGLIKEPLFSKIVVENAARVSYRFPKVSKHSVAPVEKAYSFPAKRISFKFEEQTVVEDRNEISQLRKAFKCTLDEKFAYIDANDESSHLVKEQLKSQKVSQNTRAKEGKLSGIYRGTALNNSIAKKVFKVWVYLMSLIVHIGR